MSRAIVIPPSVSLVDEVMLHLVPDGADYSRNIVVFPGKRPAHFLRKEIGAHTGKSFIPPRLFSIDTFIEHVYDRLMTKPWRDLDPFDAVVILHELHLASEDRIGSGKFDGLDSFLPLGLRMFSEMEELEMACIPPDRVESELSAVSFRGLHVLGALYRQFYAEIGRRGYCTRSMRYKHVANTIDAKVLDFPSRIVLAGFFALTSVEKNILERLMNLEETVVLFEEGKGLAERVRELHLEPEMKAGNSQSPTVRMYSASDTHGEVFGLTSRLKQSLDAGIDHRTVIVVPDPEALPPLIHQSLALVPEGRFNISLGYPHTRTPVFGFLTALTNLITSMYEGKLYAPDYLKFVLHPYTKNILLDGRSDVTRVLFHAVEELFQKRELSTFFDAAELESHGTVFKRASAVAAERGISERRMAEHLRSIHDNTFRAFLGITTVGDIARTCQEVLSYIADNSTANKHPLFRPYIISMMESLEQISRSLLAEKSFPDRTALFHVLRTCLGRGEVPFPGTPLEGLQVLGFLETRNLKFDRVFFLNTNDDIIPGTSKRHTLIPNRTRNALGLPTYKEQDQIAAYHFDVLLQGAREVDLFFSENDEKEASRFVEQLLWNEEQRTGASKREDLITTVRYEIKLSHDKPEPIPKTDDIVKELKEMTFSATRLDRYLKCGLRFYYADVLRLEEKDEVAGNVDRLGLGNFLHRVLQEFFMPYVGKKVQSRDISAHTIGEIVGKRFAEKFGGEEVGNKYLLKLQIETQLNRYIAEHEIPRLEEEDTGVIALEQACEVERHGYKFAGRIDRVEHRDGRVFILDYKTGGDKRKFRINFGKLVRDDRSTWVDAIGSLQLPMYLLLYGSSEHNGVPPVAAYVLLGRGDIGDDVEAPLFEEEEDNEERRALLEEIIFKLAGEIVDPDHPFEPPADLQEHCPTCPFTHLCGTEWVRGRRKW